MKLTNSNFQLSEKYGENGLHEFGVIRLPGLVVIHEIRLCHLAEYYCALR